MSLFLSALTRPRGKQICTTDPGSLSMDSTGDHVRQLLARVRRSKTSNRYVRRSRHQPRRLDHNKLLPVLAKCLGIFMNAW